MKLQLPKEQLARSLNLVTRAVAVKAALPVLNNILLNCEKGQLKLAATNLETSIVTTLAISSDEDGAITVPARLLSEFVNSLPTGNVKLETGEESLKVTSGKYEASFAGIAASEFPQPPQVKEADKTILDKNFAKALNQTSFAASADEGRPVLTGILLEFTKNSLNLVATDGYRLAKKTLNIDSSLETNLLIPARALNEIARLIGEAEDESEISFQPVVENNQAVFTIGQTEVTTRLLDGTFPLYQSIIPTDFKSRVVISNTELNQAVKATSLFARDLGNVVHISINADKNEIEMKANTAQVGTGKSIINGSVEGDSVSIAINSHYLTSGLAVLTSQQISLEAINSTKPVLLRSVGDDSLFYIIMPVRQQG